MNTKQISLILASGSPRRREILKKTGIPFTIDSVEINEAELQTGKPAEAVKNLSLAKMKAILNKKSDYIKKNWIVTADTLIDFKGKILGKPGDKKEARQFLTQLSGSSHKVLTSLSLYNPVQNSIREFTEATEVTFIRIGEKLLNDYLDTNEWSDAAGAYKIQEKGALFVSKINGSYDNVMGLPLCRFYAILLSNHFPGLGE